MPHYLNNHNGELGDDVRQHDLGCGHSCHPRPLQETLFALDDERQGGEADRHKVCDGQDHAGRHELGKRRLVTPVNWLLEGDR